MTATDTDQTPNDDDVGTGGPGAPTPLSSLEVLSLTLWIGVYANLYIGCGWTFQA